MCQQGVPEVICKVQRQPKWRILGRHGDHKQRSQELVRSVVNVGSECGLNERIAETWGWIRGLEDWRALPRMGGKGMPACASREANLKGKNALAYQ